MKWGSLWRSRVLKDRFEGNAEFGFNYAKFEMVIKISAGKSRGRWISKSEVQELENRI